MSFRESYVRGLRAELANAERKHDARTAAAVRAELVALGIDMPPVERAVPQATVETAVTGAGRRDRGAR